MLQIKYCQNATAETNLYQKIKHGWKKKRKENKEEKKSALINDGKNIIASWEEFKQHETLANKYASFQKQLEGGRMGLVGEAGSASSDKICIFYHHLTLENNISRT